MLGFMIGRDGIGMNNRYFRHGSSFRIERNSRRSEERSLLGEISQRWVYFF